ncbi:hypothetical protein HD554DRAFT_1547820 [Boletus coccyginus]|nr:hypothetical protein HD554DRAFT_1547820 [Boletus coccyginus]
MYGSPIAAGVLIGHSPIWKTLSDAHTMLSSSSLSWDHGARELESCPRPRPDGTESCHVNLERRDSPPDVGFYTAYSTPPLIAARLENAADCHTGVLHFIALWKLKKFIHDSAAHGSFTAGQGLNGTKLHVAFFCTKDVFAGPWTRTRSAQTCSAYSPGSLRSVIVLGPRHGRRFYIPVIILCTCSLLIFPRTDHSTGHWKVAETQDAGTTVARGGERSLEYTRKSHPVPCGSAGRKDVRPVPDCILVHQEFDHGLIRT